MVVDDPKVVKVVARVWDSTIALLGFTVDWAQSGATVFRVSRSAQGRYEGVTGTPLPT